MEGADDTCGVTAAGIVVNYASLFVTCIASYRIALFVAPLSIGPISIPRGTGFMLVGMLAAGLRPRMIKCAGATYPVFGGGTADTVDDVELNVYFPINYVCMCFIAYATGSELIVRRYRKLYKKILKVTLMVILSVFLCVSFPLFLLLDAPTSRDAVFDAGDAKLPAMSAPSLRWAVALLFGSILVSRSPASAISIVGEMRANGDYTQSALGVTICMYVGVNVVFAICQAVSIILLSGPQETLVDAANATALGEAAAASASANATGAGDGEGTDAVGVVLIFAAVLLSLFVSIVLGILLGLVLYAFVSLHGLCGHADQQHAAAERRAGARGAPRERGGRRARLHQADDRRRAHAVRAAPESLGGDGDQEGARRVDARRHRLVVPQEWPPHRPPRLRERAPRAGRAALVVQVPRPDLRRLPRQRLRRRGAPRVGAEGKRPDEPRHPPDVARFGRRDAR